MPQPTLEAAIEEARKAYRELHPVHKPEVFGCMKYRTTSCKVSWKAEFLPMFFDMSDLRDIFFLSCANKVFTGEITPDHIMVEMPDHYTTEINDEPDWAEEPDA